MPSTIGTVTVSPLRLSVIVKDSSDTIIPLHSVRLIWPQRGQALRCAVAQLDNPRWDRTSSWRLSPLSAAQFSLVFPENYLDSVREVASSGSKWRIIVPSSGQLFSF